MGCATGLYRRRRRLGHDRGRPPALDGPRTVTHCGFGFALAKGANVALSLALYIVVYLIMFPTGIAFMAGLVRRGPEGPQPEPERIESGRPNQPFEQAARAGTE